MHRAAYAPALLLTVLCFSLVACDRPADDAGAPTAPEGRTVSFGPCEVDRTPPGFTVVTGDWKAQPDPEGGGNVLAQLAASPGPVFNVILADDEVAADLELETRVYALSGRTDRGGGLVWRARDGRNYYICRWNPLESNFRLYKVIDGRRIQVAGVEAPAEGGWHRMRARMQGGHIECWLDGTKLLEAEDGDLAGPGRVGLWTKADAVTLFGDLAIAAAR